MLRLAAVASDSESVILLPVILLLVIWQWLLLPVIPSQWFCCQCSRLAGDPQALAQATGRCDSSPEPRPVSGLGVKLPRLRQRVRLTDRNSDTGRQLQLSRFDCSISSDSKSSLDMESGPEPAPPRLPGRLSHRKLDGLCVSDPGLIPLRLCAWLGYVRISAWCKGGITGYSIEDSSFGLTWKKSLWRKLSWHHCSRACRSAAIVVVVL